MDVRSFVLTLTAAGVAISLYLSPPVGASLLGGLTALTLLARLIRHQ